jgi:hypothetical protein
MSLTINPNRRQSLREIANRALADYIANGSSVQTVAPSKKKVETFRSAASVASQGRKLNTLRNAGFASR